MTVGMSIQAMAATVKKTDDAETAQALQEAQQEKEALQKELEQAQQTIRDLKESKGNVEDKVAELNKQLISISARITELEKQLTAKSEDIVQAQEDLEAAQAQEAKQYEDMKVRIRFMYENQQSSYTEALLSSGNIAEFLNAAEYIAQIQSYDRQKLESYQETVETITNLEAQLEQDYAELQALKKEVESDKASVAAMMREKEIELAGISNHISEAQNEADYYAAEIQAQEELIAAIRRAQAEKEAAGVVDNPYSGGAFVLPCPSSTRVRALRQPSLSDRRSVVKP